MFHPVSNVISCLHIGQRLFWAIQSFSVFRLPSSEFLQAYSSLSSKYISSAGSYGLASALILVCRLIGTSLAYSKVASFPAGMNSGKYPAA